MKEKTPRTITCEVFSDVADWVDKSLCLECVDGYSKQCVVFDVNKEISQRDKLLFGVTKCDLFKRE